MAKIKVSSRAYADSNFPLPLFYVWLILRILTNLWVTLISPLRSFTEQERQIAVWPPSFPLMIWLERVWILPWQRWDAIYYIWIASRGYRVDDGTAQFHPFFPWLANPLVQIGLSPLFALFLVSSVATVVLLWAFYSFARLDLDNSSSRMATMMFVCSPFAFALFVPYPESLFLLCAVLCLFWGRQQRWWMSTMVGALASLTRQQGIFLLFPIAWELWESSERNWRRVITAWREWLSLALIPGGYFVWIIYRGVVLNDLLVNYSDLNTLVYSLLISPSATKVVPVQTFMWPWQALWYGLVHLWERPDIDIVVNMVGGLYFLILLGLSWKHLRVGYRIYVLLTTLISFSYHTGPVHPYMGLLRHLLLGFPVFIGVARWAQRRWLRWLFFISGILGILFLLLLYVLEAWVP